MTGSMPESITFLSDAFGIPPPPLLTSEDIKNEARSYLVLGMAMYTIGRFEDAEPMLSKGLSLAGKPSPKSVLAVGKLFMRNLGLTTKRRAGAERVSLLMLPSLCLQAYGALAQVYITRPKPDTIQIAGALLLMRQDAIKSDDAGSMALSSAWITTAAAMLGKMSVARRIFADVSRLYSSDSENLFVRAAEGYSKMMISGFDGNWEDTRNAALQSAEAFALVGDFKKSVESNALLGVALTELGRFDEAVSVYEENVERARKQGDDAIRASSISALIYVLVWKGEHDKIPTLSTAVELLENDQAK